MTTDTQDLIDSSFELNVYNYGTEDVERLNDWAINACKALEALQAEVAVKDEAIRILLARNKWLDTCAAGASPVEPAKGHEIAALVNQLTSIAKEFHAHQSLRERVAQLVRPWAQPSQVRELSVWFGPMPESNGKSNWTAILHKGDLADGFQFGRSEYKDRVRYDADSMRHLIGELPNKPDILAYDGDLKEDYPAAINAKKSM
jgi:hypothetical protein